MSHERHVVVGNTIPAPHAGGIVTPAQPAPTPPPGVVLARCEVWRRGELVGVPEVLGGSITEDVQARTFRTGTIRINANAPREPGSMLAPGGTELRIWRWEWLDGNPVWSLLGRMYFRRAGIERASVGVTIRCHDASELVRENRFTSPHVVQAGVPHPEAAAQGVACRLNEDVWNGAEWTYTPARTRDGWVWGEDVEHDPWDSAEDLAKAVGMDMWFERDGKLSIEPVPGMDEAAAQWEWIAGDPDKGRTYLDGSREVLGRGYNGVKARTEVPASGDDDNDPPIYEALVWDEDPDSASFRGLYERPRFFTSAYLTSQRFADEAARAELLRNVGMDEDTTIEVASDSRLKPRQVSRLVDEKIRADGLRRSGRTGCTSSTL